MTAIQPQDNNAIDVDRLQAKYLEERNKRLQDNRDYMAVEGALVETFTHDPNVEPGFERAPVAEDVEMFILGGGFGGLLVAAELRKQGMDDFRIVERGGDFGGTWYWNRYPGAACDVEAYIYMPLLEDVGYVPSRKYVGTREIWEHTRAIGAHFDLYDKTLFQTSVTALRWDESLLRWIVTTDRGDEIRARFVSLATGLLARPRLPGIPGVESFGGTSFHTCRWDFSATGGDSSGGLTRLSDKRVGIIGTGASAVQCIPHLAEGAKQLYVFQRTPSAVDIRANRPTDPAWAQTLQPGWQRERMLNFDAVIAGMPVTEDLVNDRWTDVWANLITLSRGDDEGEAAPDADALRQLADYRKMEEIRQRVDDIIEDPATAEALKPWYNLFCKRPLFHDEYLPTFNRPNVTLVDTKGRNIERITEAGVVANGELHELDVLIFASGFEHNAPPYRAGDFTVTGAGGVSMEDRWADGTRSQHGVMTAGLPNLFIVGVTNQSGGTINFPTTISEQAAHAVLTFARCVKDGITRIEVSEAAEIAWADRMRRKAIDRLQFLEECTPGYYNGEGAKEKSFLNNIYGGGAFEYFAILEQWRSAGKLAGVHLQYGDGTRETVAPQADGAVHAVAAVA